MGEFKICPNCGTGNKIKAKNCVSCGHHLDVVPVEKYYNMPIIYGCIGFGILSIISLFMPYITISIFGVSSSISLSSQGSDWTFLALSALLCALCAFAKKQILSIVFALINCIIFFVELTTINDLNTSIVGKGTGYYLGLFACVGMLMCSVCMKLRKK